jgi:opacity protein-like surface antigen
MIRFAVATVVLIILISSFALAQDSTPRIQVFGGYSLLHEDTRGLTNSNVDVAMHNPSSAFGIRSNFNGWNAEVQYNLNRWVGLVGDFGGYSGVPFTATKPSAAPGLPNQTRYSFLGGPALSYRTKSRFTPYVHALFGIERAHLAASTLSGSVPPFSSVDTTVNDFTAALGGGVDFRVMRHVALRLGQVDWYHTTLNMNKFYGNAFDSTQFQAPPTRQKNLRFSAGIAVNF